MKLRIAAKVVCNELNCGNQPKQTVQRAVKRIRHRNRRRFSGTQYVAAGLTVALMDRGQCSIDAVRFGMAGSMFVRKLESLSGRELRE